MKKKKSVFDVQKAVEEKKKNHKPGSTKELEFVWKSEFSEKYGVMAQNLTGKQYGQLKQFGEQCPPGKAAEVLGFVIQNWVMFVKQVEQDTGAKSTPAKPLILQAM